MKLKIQIDKPSQLEGIPDGTAEVIIEADSPAECMFQMQRRGCSIGYVKNVLTHLAPIWAEGFPHWYGEPDQKEISKDLQKVHPGYGYVGN